ncbi:hypothetical protein NB640_02195 [Oxalobacter vibrioformis]|uniref:Uncharacterized protein n=1 Tax=Oxalobacter vibrioformis TaxID=933080 RepID=A0A9E9LWF1_9BURK|nr:hypothetical protein [Oxalobacter vibrioformis]WAW10491.1 hypothetical protein NB640_02195 [Oxalobacter vibrioformis]
MNELKLLTDDILEQIRNSWRVGIEENNSIVIFEVMSRLGNELRGDEKWIMHPEKSGSNDGPVTENPRLFFDLDIGQLVYCHSRSNGQQYMIQSLISQYG